MKTLIIITTLISTFGISNLSLAYDPMDLYINPTAEVEAANELENVCFINQVESYCKTPSHKEKQTNSVTTSDQKTDDEYINIFGVQMPRADRS